MSKSNCRDCGTCTMLGISRFGQDFAMGMMHLFTIGVSFLIKRAFIRNCPDCKHLLSRHRRRKDGSFID